MKTLSEMFVSILGKHFCRKAALKGLTFERGRFVVEFL